MWTHVSERLSALRNHDLIRSNNPLELSSPSGSLFACTCTCFQHDPSLDFCLLNKPNSVYVYVWVRTYRIEQVVSTFKNWMRIFLQQFFFSLSLSLFFAYILKRSEFKILDFFLHISSTSIYLLFTNIILCIKDSHKFPFFMLLKYSSNLSDSFRSF